MRTIEEVKKELECCALPFSLETITDEEFKAEAKRRGYNLIKIPEKVKKVELLPCICGRKQITCFVTVMPGQSKPCPKCRYPIFGSESVRHGRCALCKIKETGHGIIAYYATGWEVCINKRNANHFLVVNHEGNQIEIPIDFCPNCGAKMEGDLNG